MALSSISGITQEGNPKELASFLRSGVAYVLWSAPIAALGLYRLNWKPHSSGDYTEVSSSVALAYRNISALYDPVGDYVVAVWDDGQAVDGVENGVLTTAKFAALTGAVVSGPTVLFPGSEPQLSYLTTAQDQRFVLFYKTAKNVGVYGRRSENAGANWSSAYPLITGKVANTSRLTVVPYDGKHVSIAQVGQDTRPLREIGMFQRTRPTAQVLIHPTDPTKLFIGEPSKLNSSRVADNTRGGLVAARDNSKLYHLDGVAQGTSDTIGAVARLSISGTTLTVDASSGPVGDGDNFVHYSFVPASGTNVEMPGATNDAVSLDVSDGFAYAALRNDTGVTGELVVINITTDATSAFLTGIQAGSSVGVANFLATKLIFFGTQESGVQRLRVYSENGLTPTLLLNIKLPARANAITVAPRPSAPTVGARLYISMTDRFSIYDYIDASTPVQLVDSLSITSTQVGGEVLKARVAANGNVIVPVARGGVLALSSDGRLLAQTFLSGKVVLPWTPSTVYALNSLVRPRDIHQFSNARYYFKATTGGTSGKGEPSWSSVGTVSDNTAVWTPQTVTDGTAMDVAIDDTGKRIYVAGVADGPTGTDGRVWILDAAGIL